MNNRGFRNIGVATKKERLIEHIQSLSGFPKELIRQELDRIGIDYRYQYRVVCTEQTEVVRFDKEMGCLCVGQQGVK